MCGYEWNPEPNQILHVSGCPKCSGNYKRTQSEYINEIYKINQNIEVLGEFDGVYKKIKHKCKNCGYIWNPFPSDILHNGAGCPKCAGHMKRTHDDYIKEVKIKNPNVEVVGKYINTQTKIIHRCKTCGFEFTAYPYRILEGSGCPICCFPPLKIGPAPEYKNSIWASEYKGLAEYYGMTEEQMKTYMPHSNKKIEVKCPDCGMLKNIVIDKLLTRGIGCNKCSDNISYPEKFMMSLLDQIKVHYENQYSPQWAENRKYDFYLSKYNCIIETHGMQHYNGGFNVFGGRNLQEEKYNDELKEKLAKQNGIVNYIVIDCRESTMMWIKNNIMRSNITNLLNLTDKDISWEKCNMDALHSKIKDVAVLWNKKYSVGKIANDMKADRHTIVRWLKKAKECGLCNYTQEEANQRKCNVVLCIETNVIYLSQNKASKDLGIQQSHIGRSIKSNGRLSAGGYHFKFVEIEQNNLEGEK